MESIYENKKRKILSLVFTIVVVIFIIRLFLVQIVFDEYKLSANNNVLRYVTIYPDRGLIFDRNGIPLVENEASYDIMVIPKEVKNIDTAEFCKILEITKEEFLSRMKKAKEYSMRRASIFAREISKYAYAYLQEKMFRYKGFYIQRRTVRRYPRPIAAHVLGYIAEADQSLIERNPYYKPGDYVGKSGIEKAYEPYLRGIKGMKIVLVDVFNQEKGSFAGGKYDTMAVSGYNLITTLDAKLQEYGERLMKNKIGSIVAIEPETGEILAMVSSPGYDPRELVAAELKKNYPRLVNDKKFKPLINRALFAQYPPGSTFKLLNALIGLQLGVIKPETRFSCSRGFHYGGLSVGCHPHPSSPNLIESIQYSCNAYYCNTFWAILDRSGFKTSREGYIQWRKYALECGFGNRLNDDFPEEAKGNIPPPEYFDKLHKTKNWKALNIISLSIGQGEILATPIQMANFMACIANRGWFIWPHTVKAIGNSKYISERFREKHYVSIDQKYFDIVREGMLKVVESGTARVAKLPNIPIAGKTGTAQNPHGADHSLFVCFAPFEKPKIAMCVVVENSGFGATWAAPIASLMIEKYLTDTITRPDLEKRIMEADLINNPALFIKRPDKKKDKRKRR